MKNWWYYYKWYVICGVILLFILCDLAGNALGLQKESPDFQIAYVGKAPLPGDTADALEKVFASIGGDYNGDGKVIVRLNQYIDGGQSADMDTAYYEYASEITLIGDISDCESYFFLMDDPESFQQSFQILAASDGSCPDGNDYSVRDKVFSWARCPALAQMELGAYCDISLGIKKEGDSNELLNDLYIGRRCFYTEDTTKYAKDCSRLWDYITAHN